MYAYRRRKELRARAIEHLGGRCVICGYTECAAAFDFHHLDAWEKDFNISAKLTSWDAIVRELAKCVLLCARCHREVHDGLHPGYLTNHDAARGQYDPSGDEDD